MRCIRDDLQRAGGPASMRNACRFRSSTFSSHSSTIKSVGADTQGRASRARSTRPPRETTARTILDLRAAACNAAAEPVLAPNNPIGRPRLAPCAMTQSIALSTRVARKSISKTLARSSASSSVSRSMSSVAKSASWRYLATAWLRGLHRPLPLPWANSTMPRAACGTVNRPRLCRSPTGITTSCTAAMIHPSSPRYSKANAKLMPYVACRTA